MKIPKTLLVLILSGALCITAEYAFGQQIYKWVDEKGTVHFSETPTSDTLKPPGKQNSKERTLEVVTGVEKTKQPSKEEALTEYLRKRDRDQEAQEGRIQEEQAKTLKAIKDHQEEMQHRRDREADMLEKEARKTKTFYDHKGRVIGSGMTKEQQQMLRDAARLRSGFDLEPSPPSYDTNQNFKWPEREEKRGVTNPRTGELYPRSGSSGYTNPKTGEFFPKSGNGAINPKTGEVYR